MNTHASHQSATREQRSTRCPDLLSFLWVAIGLMLTAPPARAASSPPELMTYQGFLVDANGNPLAPSTPQNYPVVFRIHAAATGPAALWAEQQIVTVDKGNFSVLLGEGTAVGGTPHGALSTVFSGDSASDRYIGITVTIGGNATEILPRLRLVPSPYSFLASKAVNLVQPNGATVLSSANGQVNVSGNISASGVISGNGSGLTALNAANISSGLFSDARIPNILGGDRFFSGNVGIGTTAGLNARLQVGSFGNADEYLMVASAGGNQFRSGIKLRHFNNEHGWTIESDERDNSLRFMGHYFDSVGATLLYMNRPSGNMGLGTVAPGRRLQIGDISVPNSEGMIRLASRSGTDGANRVWDIGVPETDGNSVGASIGYSFVIDDTQRAGTEFIVKWGSGNVGIGTTDPAVALDINSSSVWRPLAVRGNGGTDMVVMGNLSGRASIGAHNGAGNAWADLSINPGGGRVGINYLSPEDQLHLRGGVLRIDDGGGEWIRLYRSANGLILHGNGMGNPNNAGGIGIAQWDGDSNLDGVSDRRLKKDIADAEPVLERVMQLPVRRFRWKNAAEDSAKKFGVIAQEVEPLFPESVGSLTPPEDLLPEGMLAPDESEEMLTVKHGTFGLIAVKALQELKAEKDSERAAMQKEISDLKHEVAQLRVQASRAEQVRVLEDELAELKRVVQRLVSAKADVETAGAPIGGDAPASDIAALR